MLVHLIKDLQGVVDESMDGPAVWLSGGWLGVKHYQHYEPSSSANLSCKPPTVDYFIRYHYYFLL